MKKGERQTDREKGEKGKRKREKIESQKVRKNGKQNVNVLN